MTFKHIAASYFRWIWGQWGRLSALFVTVGVIVSLTIGMTRATRRYDALSARVQAAFHRQDAPRPPALYSSDLQGRERVEVLQKLDEILARLPADRGASPVTHGPLSSSQ